MTKKSVMVMVKPFLTEILVTVAALLLLAFFMLKMEWGQEKIQIGVQVVYGLACFLGGWSAGRGAEKRKFLRGLEYGAVYFVLLCVLSLASGRSLDADTLQVMTVFAVCGVSGMAGGMFSLCFPH